MKKITILIIIAILLTGTAFAQGRTPQREIETVTISGTLKLERGIVALQSGENTYLVPMLSRYAGFIDGLREGAAVSVKGQVFRNTLRPQELTIDSRQYELASRQNFESNRNAPRHYSAPNRKPLRQFNAPNHRDAPRRFNAPNHRNAPPRHDAPNRNTPRRDPRQRAPAPDNDGV